MLKFPRCFAHIFGREREANKKKKESMEGEGIEKERERESERTPGLIQFVQNVFLFCFVFLLGVREGCCDYSICPGLVDVSGVL